MAQSVGIDTRRLFTLTFALGSGLAGLGGGLGADILAIHPGYAARVPRLLPDRRRGRRPRHLRGPFVAALLLGFADTACKYSVPEFGAFFIYAATIGAAAVAARGPVRTRLSDARSRPR